MSATYPPEQLANGYSPNHHAYTNGHGHSQSMDGRPGEYPQSGLASPYNQPFTGDHSEENTLDQASAAQYPQSQSQDVKYNPSATPTSDYGMSQSAARPAAFPEYIQRATYPDGSRYSNAGPQGSTPGNMAQSSSPSSPLNNGHSVIHHRALNTNSDHDIPVDPSIAASSPAYPQHHYAYAPQHDAPHYQSAPPMYPQHTYAAQYPGHPISYGHVPPAMPTPPQMVSAGTRPPGVSVALYPSLSAC